MIANIDQYARRHESIDETITRYQRLIDRDIEKTNREGLKVIEAYTNYKERK